MAKHNSATNTNSRSINAPSPVSGALANALAAAIGGVNPREVEAAERRQTNDEARDRARALSAIRRLKAERDTIIGVMAGAKATRPIIKRDNRGRGNVVLTPDKSCLVVEYKPEVQGLITDEGSLDRTAAVTKLIAINSALANAEAKLPRKAVQS